MPSLAAYPAWVSSGVLPSDLRIACSVVGPHQVPVCCFSPSTFMLATRRVCFQPPLISTSVCNTVVPPLVETKLGPSQDLSLL